MSEFSEKSAGTPAIPDDDLRRTAVVARPDTDASLEHLALVGDTYTVLLRGEDTAGRYCLIDMHIPPGGGPPPHRHDFEETFAILEGELEATFRGVTQTVRGGETIHIPANAPHQIHNASDKPVRALCTCARLPDRRSSSERSGLRWRRERRLRRRWTKRRRRLCERKPVRWPRSTARSS